MPLTEKVCSVTHRLRQSFLRFLRLAPVRCVHPAVVHPAVVHPAVVRRRTRHCAVSGDRPAAGVCHCPQR